MWRDLRLSEVSAFVEGCVFVTYILFCITESIWYNFGAHMGLVLSMREM